MTEGDLRALVTIDRRITGRDRAAYFQRKLADALTESTSASRWSPSSMAGRSGSSWRASISANSAGSKPPR